MRNTNLTLAAITLIGARPLTAQQIPDLAPYMMSDRAAEVALARSAAPAFISDSAAVLVLTRSGFVAAVRGSNGFTCVVLRSFSGRLGDPDFWNPRVRAPHCFNPPAVRTVLVGILKRAEWILSGLPLADVRARTERAFAAHQFPMPAAGAMAYMLSPQQYLLDADPHWMPHLMFYYDKSLPGATWGAGGMTAAVIDASVGDQELPIRTLLIPVPRWSDGTTAPSHAGG